MDRLRAFEVFVTVVSRGSFTRAADALDTSPANVTRYVNELESHLGTRLLNRSSRKLSLTESGEALFERSKSILDEVAETEALVSSSSLQPRGRLRINAPLSFGILHLAPLWPEFMQKYPDVELDVALIDRVVDLVEDGYDMAIRISRVGTTSHAARKLATSQNILCASPEYLKRHGHPQTPADLREHACVCYTYSGDEWHFNDDHGKAHSVKVTGQMHSNNGDTARAAALAGRGVIWQPTFLIGDDLRSGRLVPLLPGYRLPEIDVLAMYPSRRHLSAKVRVMVDFLVEAFSGVPPWDR
ncbi:LysR family transcriptional regulator [Pseudomonas cavernicola]|uniref:LysR family transcriptional regulator n=1 Tax=Pseudomonas cavernicola TaxID=2320866 RepID=A0A418XLZ9_9PSED|nr:LysR family transcriptional regulator [Pseudomonas cavernicola]RJG13475.1 LysR family transcriptional regulator [Pseudomonas cavernicola]